MANTTITSGGEATQADVVAAMFETRDAAQAAHDALVSTGIDPATIEIVNQGAPATPAKSPGLWAAIRRRLIPAEHAHGYAEGVERGHALLFVRAAPHQQAQVMHLLEGLEPIDVMNRTRDWKQSGWSGVHRGETAFQIGDEEPTLHFQDQAYPDHQRATGLINENDHPLRLGNLVNPMGIKIRTTGTSRVRRFEADRE